MGGLAMATSGGELCGGAMLVIWQLIAAAGAAPEYPYKAASTYDFAAFIPCLRELALLGAVGLVGGLALERKRARKSAKAKSA